MEECTQFDRCKTMLMSTTSLIMRIALEGDMVHFSLLFFLILHFYSLLVLCLNFTYYILVFFLIQKCPGFQIEHAIGRFKTTASLRSICVLNDSMVYKLISVSEFK